MDAYIVDWLNLLGRWLHFVTGIAWIGSSFQRETMSQSIAVR